MILRIVQMTFKENEVANFLSLFAERKEKIKNQKGCMHLELWQDAHKNNVLFTYSIWENEMYLDHYRFSDFFKDTWGKTKALFSDRPQAWSVMQKEIVNGTLQQ